jgi:hypothetical protein
MVYYDAASKKVYSLNAGYNTVLEEKDPLTIPGGGKPSGRTALVPGFFAGVQAAHDRFGKLPFASLFDPAIYLVEAIQHTALRRGEEQMFFIFTLPHSHVPGFDHFHTVMPVPATRGRPPRISGELVIIVPMSTTSVAAITPPFIYFKLQWFAYECSGSDTRQPLVESAKIRPPRQRRLILAVGLWSLNK